MSFDKEMKQIQSILGDGLVIIVGCGLSSAEGLPGMRALADHLNKTITPIVPSEFSASWNKISGLLTSGCGLEEVLSGRGLPDTVNSSIVLETAKLILEAEGSVISEVLSGERTLRFSNLLQALPPTPSEITVLTTNYDRLIEVACEVNGLPVDSMFAGSSIGKFNRQESAYSFCRGIEKRQGKYVLKYTHRLKLFKPHGSLDWYQVNSKPIRCPYPINLPPLIIPPGETKYRVGYNEPFDAHREYANKAIDNAKRYLIIGYGFNDDHLQTHLERNLKGGKSCLLVSHSLSSNAVELMQECSGFMALSADKKDDGLTCFHDVDGNVSMLDGEYWDLTNLVEGVLI